MISRLINKNAKNEFEYIRQTHNEPFTFDNDILYVKCGKKTYINCYSGFDIETSSINEFAFMYKWQLSIKCDDYLNKKTQYVISGRQWQEFIDILDRLIAHFELNKNKRIIIWVANLSYEFQFMRKWLNITDGFFREKRKPFYIVHNECIEFREALNFVGNSLKKLAENVCNTQKCVGDLDFSIVRDYNSILSEKEEGYCDNDVIILSEFSEWYFKKYIIERNFTPVSIQSDIRRQLKEKAKADFNIKELQRNIMSAMPSETLYNIMMSSVFRGGYVHANYKYVGKTLDKSYKMGSWDYTSSYPGEMEHKYMPFKFIRIENDMFNDDLLKKKCCIIIVTFYNIENTTNHSIESKSKCIELESPLIDNGRILKAKKMTVALTELDYLIYKKFYKWSKKEIKCLYIADKIKLPNYLLSTLENPYIDKSILKSQHNNYAYEKSVVNSNYGVLVTKRQVNEIKYNNETSDYDIEEGQDYYSYCRNSITLPQWGLWITAHARFKICSMIFAIENSNTKNEKSNRKSEVVYCDTDSLKVTHYKEVEQLINDYNNRTMEINKSMCKKRDLPFEYFNDLNCLDFEGEIKTFKTLGAKRYIYVDKNNKIHQTIAGLPKDTLLRVAKNQHLKSKKKYNIFKEFDNNMMIEDTNKLCAKYNDNEQSIIYNNCYIYEKSSVCLCHVDFNLKMDKIWLDRVLQSTMQNEFLEKR